VTQLLRADWIRYRRRLDLWVIVIGVVLFSTIGFLSGYRRDATDPEQLSEAQIRQQIVDTSFYEGMTQEEIDADIDLQVQSWLASQEQERLNWEQQQQITLQQYDVAQAPLTILGFGFGPLIAGFLIATLIVGDEFRHATIRTSLLAASHRRRFLAARLVTISAITAGLFALVVALGLILSVGLHLVGAELPRPTIVIDGGSALALVGGELLSVFAAIGLGIAMTVILRSGAFPLLLILIYAFIELFLANLPVFAERQPLAGMHQLFLTQSARHLLETLGQATNALAFSQSFDGVDPGTLAPLWTSAVIVAAWLALFVAIADRRFRTMDIVE
jgi:ABC-type transport system involved in multi-copper enzyme maturation permease subunit